MAYTDTFILIADDCPATSGENPSSGRETRTWAEIEFDLLTNDPYTYDHLAFTHKVHEIHKSQSGETPLPFDDFHAKGQPCMRASPLIKRYGWGTHYDAKGRIAIYPVEGRKYARLSSTTAVTLLKGMRHKRAK